MSGIVGGAVEGSLFEGMVHDVAGRSGASEVFEHSNASLAVSAPGDPPLGTRTWRNGRRAGVVYGSITNLDEHDLDIAGVFERLWHHPAPTAEQLEGGFLIATYDASIPKFLLVTDKLGARPCYFTRRGRFLFGSSVSALLPAIDDPACDTQAISDMLLMGHLWGDRTLVQEVESLRPATILAVTPDERSVTRYWKPSFDPLPPGDAYLDELARRYRKAIRRTKRTLPESSGIWLSGGLDSRTTAAALVASRSESDVDLEAITYDANPPTNDNPEIAGAVAEQLDISLRQVPLSAETFADNFDRVIDATDGMIRWNTAANLSTSYDLDPTPDVMMEGMSGALLGDHLLRPHLTDCSSVVDSQYASEASSTAEAVRQYLTVDIDPLGTFKRERERTDERTVSAQALDIHFQNYYLRHASTSNDIMRDGFDSRLPHADGEYLDWCARLPLRYRKGAVSLSDTTVPYGTTRTKLELCRRIAPSLSDIPYERTKVRPSRPYPAHVAGFVANVLVGRLRSEPTYGGGQLADFWVRDSSTAVHRRVRGLLDDAKSRGIFDADAITELFDRQMAGANEVPMIAQITTIERYLQGNLD